MISFAIIVAPYAGYSCAPMPKDICLVMWGSMFVGVIAPFIVWAYGRATKRTFDDMAGWVFGWAIVPMVIALGYIALRAVVDIIQS